MVLNWSDAWLMLAIAMANQRGLATLETIIAAGDEINFLIFSPEELESGLVRLTEAGYIAEKSGEFSLTEKIRPSESFLSEASTDKRLKAVQEMLCAASAPDDQPCRNNLRYPGFSKERYEEAVRSYRGYL